MYDIICQWALYLKQHMLEYLDELHIDLADFATELCYVISKLHWHSHKEEGHVWFSLNYIPSCRHTDNKGIERRWWEIQPIASSTRMMGPGGRQGSLNDVWGFTNWLKLISLDK